MRPALALAAAALMVVGGLSGCGLDVSQNDDRDPDPAAVRAGLAVLWADGDTSPEVLDEATCFSAALTDRLTLDQLVEAEIVLDDGTVTVATPVLDRDVAGAWVDAAESCTPYVQVAARTLAARLDGRLDREAYAACLADAVPPERLRAALVATLTGTAGADPAAAELERAARTCP